MNFSSYQKTAEEFAKGTGKILQQYRKKAVVEKTKSDFLDIVTNADLAAEEFLIRSFHKSFPDHNLFTEESAEGQKYSDFVWVIDPLDGTKEYIRGLPMYNVSIALEYKGEIVVGVVFRPATNELFSASKGNGAYLNERKIHVSQEKKLINSFIFTRIPDLKMPQKEAEFTWFMLQKITRNAYRLRTYAEDVTSLCWLALGAGEGYILFRPNAKWWDIAPGLLMVKEANGKITNINGEPIENRDLSKGLVASNGKIHNELLRYLRV